MELRRGAPQRCIAGLPAEPSIQHLRKEVSCMATSWVQYEHTQGEGSCMAALCPD